MANNYDTWMHTHTHTRMYIGFPKTVLRRQRFLFQIYFACGLYVDDLHTYWIWCNLFLHYGCKSFYVVSTDFEHIYKTPMIPKNCISKKNMFVSLWEKACKILWENSMKELALQFNKPSTSSVATATDYSWKKQRKKNNIYVETIHTAVCLQFVGNSI